MALNIWRAVGRPRKRSGRPGGLLRAYVEQRWSETVASQLAGPEADAAEAPPPAAETVGAPTPMAAGGERAARDDAPG